MTQFLLKIIAISVFLVWSPADAKSLTQTCPEDAPALAPAPLEEEWAVEWWMPRHEEKLQEEGRETADILFLGDSITHGWETTGREISVNYFSDYSIYNIGFSGDRTENVLWRFEHGEIDGINPKLAVMMIGTNNTGHRQDPPECTARGIEVILEELKEQLPETKILLLAIFPRGETPENELRQLNSQINNRKESFADEERVYYLNINHIFLDENGNLSEEIMPDELHPNEYGYELWAEEMLPMIREMIKK